MHVIDVIRKQPQAIAASGSVADAARLMDEGAVGALAVTEGERLVGIVTDRDIVVRGVARKIALDARIDSVMTAAPVTIDINTDLHEAIGVFRTHAFRRLPVVDGPKFMGMLTVDDLLIDLTAELADLVRPVTGQVLFGHREPAAPTVPAEVQ